MPTATTTAPNAAEWIERYAKRLREQELPDAERRTAMNRANPKYALRNYLAQAAIEKAERGDFSEIGRLMDLLRKQNA